MTNINSASRSRLMVNGKPLAGQHIDGFVGSSSMSRAPTGPRPIQKPLAKAKVKHIKNNSELSPVATRVTSNPRDVKVKARALQKSKTLHRAAVKKPNKVTAKAATTEIKRQPAGYRVPTDRISRAQSVKLHPHISRYKSNRASEPAAVNVSHAALKVVPAPKEAAGDPVSPPSYQPVVKQAQTSPTQNIYEKHLSGVLNSAELGHKKQTTRLFKRMSFVAPSLAALVLIGGFAAYQQLPNISMRVAANRAGFSATMPKMPSGFSLAGPISYQEGKVSVTINSNSDDRTATIDQQISELDSESLRSGYLEANNIDYQVFTHKGKTIFIFGDDATWVNKGVRYTLEGDSQLTPQQILDLASSL